MTKLIYGQFGTENSTSQKVEPFSTNENAPFVPVFLIRGSFSESFVKQIERFWQHSTDHVWSLSSEIDRTDCSRQIQEKIGPLLFTNAFCGLSDNYDVFSEP